MNATRLATATRVLLRVAIIFKLVLLVAYVFHMRWVMDEFGQGYWGRSVPIGLYSKVELVKTVLPVPPVLRGDRVGRFGAERVPTMAGVDRAGGAVDGRRRRGRGVSAA